MLGTPTASGGGIKRTFEAQARPGKEIPANLTPKQEGNKALLQVWENSVGAFIKSMNVLDKNCKQAYSLV